jgi:hypothetical protein
METESHPEAVWENGSLGDYVVIFYLFAFEQLIYAECMHICCFTVTIISYHLLHPQIRAHDFFAEKPCVACQSDIICIVE